MDLEFIRELFGQFRPVTIRKMFSGAGVSADGVTFALLLLGALYLKADETSVAAFEAEGSQPFTYTRTRDGKSVVVGSYWRMPERLYDDPEELAAWGARSFEVAQRTKASPRSKPSPRKKAAPRPKPVPRKKPASRRPALKRAAKSKGSARKARRR